MPSFFVVIRPNRQASRDVVALLLPLLRTPCTCRLDTHMLFPAPIGIAGIGLEITQAMSLSLKKQKRTKRTAPRKCNGNKVQPGTCNIRIHVATNYRSTIRRTEHCKYEYSYVLGCSASQHLSTVLLPSINVASSRLPSRRFSPPSPWIWFGNPESLCSVSPQRSGYKRQWQYYTMLQYDARMYERGRKKDPAYVCRGNSSRFFRRSPGLQILTADKLVLQYSTAASYMDMCSRGELLGDAWVLVESTPGRQLLPESGLCSWDGAIHNQQSPDACLSWLPPLTHQSQLATRTPYSRCATTC
ncbi:hypothetical protein V8C34DRAFT_177084 [Trichoderma compactum]